MEMLLIYVIITLLGALGTVVWWVLQNKDKEQGSAITSHTELINTLFTKHDEDVRALHAFQREIDRNHYPKSELDPKFDAMLRAVERLSDKIESLVKALMEHMAKEDTK